MARPGGAHRIERRTRKGGAAVELANLDVEAINDRDEVARAGGGTIITRLADVRVVQALRDWIEKGRRAARTRRCRHRRRS